MLFDNKLKYNNYYDNYIYKKIEMRQILMFDSFNIIIRLSIIYKYIFQYLNLLFFNKCNKSLIINLITNFTIIIK